MIKAAHNVKAITTSVDNAELPRHRWYPIKEGFSAKLVSDSVNALIKSKRKVTVIEPFSGSGTTPVECALLGVSCLAFEVNPFLAFVGRAKLKQPNLKNFSKRKSLILRGVKTPLKTVLEDYSTFCEKKGKAKWLFNRPVLRAFAGGWKASENCTTEEKPLFQLALMRSIMDNCNAYPDGKCLRYKRLDDYRCFTSDSFIESFEAYFNIIKDDLLSSPLKRGLAHVEHMDSRRMGHYQDKSKFDLCITSPPYLNSFDYSDVYRPELFLGGFVSNNEELMKIRLKTMRSHVQANWTLPTQSAFGTLYAKAMKQLDEKKDDLWSGKIPQMIQAYFEDMQNLLKTLKTRANRGATLKIAVGTSAYAGVVIPVDLVIADIAERTGWLLKEVQVIRRLRSSAQLWKHEDNERNVPELRESIVILNSPT